MQKYLKTERFNEKTIYLYAGQRDAPARFIRCRDRATTPDL